MQHYTLAERKLFRVYCGHCVHIKPRHKRPDTKVCENFAPGEKDTDAFVTEEYLTKALLQRLLSMRLPVCADLFLQLLFIKTCFLLCDAFPHLLTIGPRLHMGRVYEYFGGIYQFLFIALKKDVFEDLLKKVGIFKTAGIVLSES